MACSGGCHQIIEYKPTKQPRKGKGEAENATFSQNISFLFLRVTQQKN